MRRVLLPAALAGVALAAGAALGGGADHPHTAAAATVSGDRVTLTVPDVKWRLPSGPGDDVIEVNGKRCPKGHPRRVGTSSSDSWSQTNDGPLRHKKRRVLLCAR